MTAYTSAGSTFAISAGLPTTLDNNLSTGYPSLTYTSVGELETIEAFGDAYELVTFISLADRRVQKFKGSVNGGSMNITYALDLTDNGQDLVRAARASDNAYSVKITNQRGDSFYFKVKVMNEDTDIGGADQITMGSATMEIDSALVEVPLTSS